MKSNLNKSNISKAVCMVLLLITCAFSTACSKVVSKVSLNDQPLAAISTQEVSTTSVEPKGVTEKVIETTEEFAASKFPLIAAIPEKDIYLYGIKESGVILYVEGIGHYFDWAYITPRFVLPRMYLKDFDSDGKEELAVILYTGSGTGYAVEELHVVEIHEEVILSREPSSKDYFKPNPEYFSDHYYKPEDYLAELDKQVKLKTYLKKDELMADIIICEEPTTISLKPLQSIEKGISFGDKPYFGDVVFFNYNNGSLTAEFALGLTSNAFVQPNIIGKVTAEVSYTKGRFSINNLHFAAEEDIY